MKALLSPWRDIKNLFFSLLLDKPFCRPDQQDVYGVAPSETVKIPCDVIGDPSGNMRFEWVFNTSTEWYPKQPQSIFGVRSRERGYTRAYIEHTPKVRELLFIGAFTYDIITYLGAILKLCKHF